MSTKLRSHNLVPLWPSLRALLPPDQAEGADAGDALALRKRSGRC